MKKIFTSLFVVLAFCTVLFAAVQTELRLHVYRNGDNGVTYHVVSEVDSMKFSYDTLEYKVSFVNWNGTVLQSSVLQSGSMPEYKGEVNPTREQTAKYTYDFKGWTPEIEEVQSEATYTADYDSTIRKYEVVFLDMDGEVISTEFFDYGTMPSCSGEFPTKENTKLYDYETKWDPELAEVMGDATYMAYFDSTKHEYTCIFNDYDGKELYRTATGTYDFEWTTKPSRAGNIDYLYYFKEWSLDESWIEDNILVYTAVYDSTQNPKKDGALIIASFKVSDSTSVYFSQGNLQFTTQGSHKTADSTAKGTWRFAENQYDYVGYDNDSISETYKGWIDLFGWGTSGWDSGAECYQPWSIDPASSYYHPGNDSYSNLTGDYANADWGVYNAISNGGNEPNKWRTLTTSEWQYLIKNNKWTLGYVKTTDKDSILCFMLIPEKFTEPEGTACEVLSPENLTSYHVSNLIVPSTNRYTTEEFASLENLGVVALPCVGYRDVWSTCEVGFDGFYWTSSAIDTDFVCEFYFYSTDVHSYFYNSRYYGRAVRLVQDVK